MRKLGIHNYTCETPTPGPLCFHVADWLNHLRSQKYSPRTVYSHWHALREFEAYIMEKKIDRPQDITLDDLEAYRLHLIELHRAAATVTSCMGILVNFFRHLETRQVVFKNPAAAIVQHRSKDPIHPVPSMQEMEKLLAMPDVSNDIGIRDRALMETLYSSGARLEEVTRLTVFDPDLDRGMIRVIGKFDKERTVPLGKQAIFWLEKYIREARPKRLAGKPDVHALWIGRQRKPMNPQIIERTIRDYAIRAGIKTPITPHAIRRACATHMLENGAHPVQIQMLLGHASLLCLSQYLRVTVTEMRKMHRKSRLGR